MVHHQKYLARPGQSRFPRPFLTRNRSSISVNTCSLCVKGHSSGPTSQATINNSPLLTIFWGYSHCSLQKPQWQTPWTPVERHAWPLKISLPGTLEVCSCAFSAPPGWRNTMVFPVKPASSQHAQLPFLPLPSYQHHFVCTIPAPAPGSLGSLKATLARPPVCLFLNGETHSPVELVQAKTLGFLYSRNIGHHCQERLSCAEGVSPLWGTLSLPLTETLVSLAPPPTLGPHTSSYRRSPLPVPTVC